MSGIYCVMLIVHGDERKAAADVQHMQVSTLKATLGRRTVGKPPIRSD